MTTVMSRRSIWGTLAIAPLLAWSLSLPSHAQTINVPEVSPTPASELPRFTSPDAPAVVQAPLANTTIQREQAPLPLGVVYQTPIEQFQPAFADVPTNHWAYEAVTRLFYSGIVSGFPASP